MTIGNWLRKISRLATQNTAANKGAANGANRDDDDCGWKSWMTVGCSP